jgi:hypothetical protein
MRAAAPCPRRPDTGVHRVCAVGIHRVYAVGIHRVYAGVYIEDTPVYTSGIRRCIHRVYCGGVAGDAGVVRRVLIFR